MSISSVYNIDISRVRGVVNNANKILEVRKHYSSKTLPFFVFFFWLFSILSDIMPLKNANLYSFSECSIVGKDRLIKNQ